METKEEHEITSQGGNYTDWHKYALNNLPTNGGTTSIGGTNPAI